MKKIITTLAAFFTAVLICSAQNIFVVDMAKAHSNYYKAKAADAQLKTVVDSTTQELQRLDAKRQELAKPLQELIEKAQNPAVTDDAKKEIQKEAEPKIMEMRQIEQNMQTLQQETRNRLQQQAQQIAAVHREEIVAVVQKIAEAKKADFIIEKAGTYFSKPSADITEDVIKELNKDAPAEPPAAVALPAETK